MSQYCQHEWETVNLRTELPHGTLIHAIVLCDHCKTIKAPIKFGDYVLQGSEAERVRNSNDRQEPKG